MTDENAIILKIKNNKNSSLFNILFNKYNLKLKGYINSYIYTHYSCYADILLGDDYTCLIWETILEAVDAHDPYQAKYEFARMLYTVLHRKMIRVVSKEHVCLYRNNVIRQTSKEKDESADDIEDSMRNDSEREDQLDKVKKFLLHESWLTQNIIKAKLHGENTQQIAENLKVSQAKINNAYSRFVKRFQKINGIS